MKREISDGSVARLFGDMRRIFVERSRKFQENSSAKGRQNLRNNVEGCLSLHC